MAKAIDITFVEIAPIEHKGWSHAGIIHRRHAVEFAELLKDTRPASMSEHPDDRIFHIKDKLLEKADANLDSEAWVDFAGKQNGKKDGVVCMISIF
ncbi:hypothetical protein V8C26DRAFT_427312 [Trichoderma gracile]